MEFLPIPGHYHRCDQSEGLRDQKRSRLASGHHWPGAHQEPFDISAKLAVDVTTHDQTGTNGCNRGESKGGADFTGAGRKLLREQPPQVDQSRRTVARDGAP
jgi:hypothetical protein